MARCYYLDYISKGCLSSYDNDEYVCKLCGKHFATNDPQVKYTCNPDYGEEYQRCPVYRDLHPRKPRLFEGHPDHAGSGLHGAEHGAGGGCPR